MKKAQYPAAPSGLSYVDLYRQAKAEHPAPVRPPPQLRCPDLIALREVRKMTPGIVGHRRWSRYACVTPFALLCCDKKGFVRNAVPLSMLASVNYAVAGGGRLTVLFNTLRMGAPNKPDLPDILLDIQTNALEFCDTIFKIKQLRGEVMNDVSQQQFIVEAPSPKALEKKAFTGRPEGYDVAVTLRELLSWDRKAVAYLGERGLLRAPIPKDASIGGAPRRLASIRANPLSAMGGAEGAAMQSQCSSPAGEPYASKRSLRREKAKNDAKRALVGAASPTADASDVEMCFSDGDSDDPLSAGRRSNFTSATIKDLARGFSHVLRGFAARTAGSTQGSPQLGTPASTMYPRGGGMGGTDASPTVVELQIAAWSECSQRSQRVFDMAEIGNMEEGGSTTGEEATPTEEELIQSRLGRGGGAARRRQGMVPDSELYGSIDALPDAPGDSPMVYSPVLRGAGPVVCSPPPNIKPLSKKSRARPAGIPPLPPSNPASPRSFHGVSPRR